MESGKVRGKGKEKTVLLLSGLDAQQLMQQVGL